MNISLTPELDAFVRAKVESGMYNNASEVIREALRLLFEQDETKSLKLNLLKKELQKGIDSLDKGKKSSRTIDSLAEEILKDKGQ